MSSRTVEQAKRFVELSCRALDIFGALVLLTVLSPLILAIAIAVRLDSRGPAVFRQQRVGRGGRLFTVNKFRSMYVGVAHDTHRAFVVGLINGEPPRHEHLDRAGAPNEDEAASKYFKMMADPRVTRMGRLLRRSSLDELPQLWNVLRGSMSLVGPRPPIPYEVEEYPREWLERLSVRPGITGPWQVGGRSRVTMQEMVRLDIEYARNRNVLLNLKLLILTVPAVLGGRGAW
jgi:lipopolysaccharide/colanic/teichoic acid biosynthesis glycosyltransferase